jgi:hypothetical protein
MDGVWLFNRAKDQSIVQQRQLVQHDTLGVLVELSVHEEEAFPVVAHGASWDAFTNDAKSSFEERTGSIRECRRKRLQACCKNRSP